MKHVVILGGDFAPSGLPPALRIRFFARHLPEFGWQPTVVTTDPSFYDWPIDPENERLLPGTYEVIRTPALPATLTRKVGLGDVGARSMWYHWQAIAELHKRRPIDMVFIPVPPYIPMVMGRLLHLRLGLPYVIDYIDPWVSEYYWTVPKAQRPPKWPLAYALSRVLEPFALRDVAHLVGVSQATTDGVVERYGWLETSDGTEIPYGGEPGDFEHLRAAPRRNPIFDPHDGHLHLSYVGTFNVSRHAITRAVLAAIQQGLREQPELFQRLRLHFVGTTYAPDPSKATEQVMPLIREAGLEGMADEHPARVPYLDSLQILLDSHTLLAVGSDEPHYTASKIFPSILAGRPLLAIFHEASNVVQTLRETGAGEAVTFNAESPPGDHVQAIFEQLRQRLIQGLNNEPPQTRWADFQHYTTRAMTARLAQVFDQALAKPVARRQRRTASLPQPQRGAQ